jgi:F-type H+-transporting ATPase subunit gamma
LANAIYAALTEAHACEQSARCVQLPSEILIYQILISASLSVSSRNAMDNASKNAKDMINSLQMQYNRGRQAAITNELVDIITGASSGLQTLHVILINSFYFYFTGASAL